MYALKCILFLELKLYTVLRNAEDCDISLKSVRVAGPQQLLKITLVRCVLLPPLLSLELYPNNCLFKP